MSKRWSSRSSDDLVAEAIRRRHGTLKYIGLELSRRPPCELSALRVVAAFREQRLEPSEAAFLLGSTQHAVGYDTLRQILAAPRLSDPGSHVAEALLKIDQLRAEADLVALVMHAPTGDGRDESARGLIRIGSAAARAAVLGAAAAGRVRPGLAAPALLEWGLAPATVMSWFASGRRDEAELGCEVVALGCRSRAVGPGSCTWTREERADLLRLAEHAIFQGQADPKPYVRTALRRPTRHRLIAPRSPRSARA
jgi:hypothetical protein